MGIMMREKVNIIKRLNSFTSGLNLNKCPFKITVIYTVQISKFGVSWYDQYYVVII